MKIENVYGREESFEERQKRYQTLLECFWRKIFSEREEKDKKAKKIRGEPGGSRRAITPPLTVNCRRSRRR